VLPGNSALRHSSQSSTRDHFPYRNRPLRNARQPRLAATGVRAGLSLCATLAMALALACSDKVPTFEEIKPADQLYAEGLKTLEGRRILWMFTLINYDDAIEKFQSIIDNYPYSDFEQKATPTSTITVSKKHWPTTRTSRTSTQPTRKCRTRFCAQHSVISIRLARSIGISRRPTWRRTRSKRSSANTLTPGRHAKAKK